MPKRYSNFKLERILYDGRKLEIKLQNSNLSEQLICLKLARHIIDAIEQYKRFMFVENFIQKSMRKLRCKKK